MPTPSSPLFDALNRVGFKRWYEQQLMASHGHLVLCLFCLLGLVGGFEAYTRAAQDMADRLMDMVAILASAAIGVWSLRQYVQRMSLAEFVASQATCPQCGTYGRLRGHCAHDQGAEVSCLKCGARWDISA
ncbi:MAG: hypothetical protein J0L58_14515 [Burkholderiales bacterium]|uniref:hypothetical protein n=1 Tax=Inhella sp. TaxID=1921806 RepID=UPI001AD4A009|nr:hypothetical protein [Burkholderiales bacterium]